MPADAPNQDEVLANQSALHIAQQSSVAKALAAQFGYSEDEESDDHAQEEQLTLRTSDTAGIGYQTPTNEDDSSRQESAATERLRRQLLGKNARAPPGALNASGGMVRAGQKHAASKPQPKFARKRGSSDEEDEGRSSMGKKRIGPVKAVPARPAAELKAAEDISPATTTASVSAPSKKRGGSYLDQVLAERAAKKKRKKNNKISEQS